MGVLMATPAFPPVDRELRQRMQRINDLLQEIDRFKDPMAKARTREIVQAIMEFHGTAVERLMEAAWRMPAIRG